MATVERLLERGTRRGSRSLFAIGEEFRDKRLAVGLSQQQVANPVGIARSTYTRIEAGNLPSLSVLLATQIAGVLGLDLSVRAYPGANPLRDAAQLQRLMRVLVNVSPPLSRRSEVPLPVRSDYSLEQRAWDAMVFGIGRRTAFEMEMRIRDAQALERRIELKRRDDPVESLVLLVADTHGNRLVLRENPGLFPGLARLTFAALARFLRAGQHPPSAIVFV